MSQAPKTRPGDVFIVDNSDQDWKVKHYLHDWAELANKLDIATGYFEIGALLGLDGQWQKIENLRILMGDDVSWRTKKALTAGISKIEKVLDTSIEKEKEENDFLTGVPAIVDALTKGKIACRVYTKRKFHAKAYITYGKHAVVGSFGLVGSSNFTLPGLLDNVELNVQVRAEVEQLQQWYETHWNEAEEITPDILRVIQRHISEYSPFLVYAKSLQEFFRGHEMTASEWEQTASRVYPILDQYQREGYQALMKIARQYRGAFLCDGVGLGKTFVGLMLIERLIERERKRVALIVPKAARESVWEMALRRYLPHCLGPDYSNLAIYNHSDLLRGGNYPERIARLKQMADVVVIDEAHHFRNPGIKGKEGEERKSHYWQMFDLCEGKDVYMLTATPVNNRLLDLQHMIELFSHRDPAYFNAAPLGIHSLPGHFRKMEKELERQVFDREGEDGGFGTNQVEAAQILSNDALFRAVVVQRSRAYVQKSQQQQSGTTKAIFPVREAPRVIEFNLKKTYGRLLEMIEQAFNKEKPLFSLSIYYPLAYYKGPDTSIDPLQQGRQKEVVSLIRIQFLKRFESSARAFEMSCETLLQKLLAFLIKHCRTESELRRLERWKTKYTDLIGYVQSRQRELWGEDPDELEDDLITPEMLEQVEDLSRDEYKVDEIIDDTLDDIHQVAEFLEELKKFKSEHDDKLRALKNLLKTDSVLEKHKVLIFTEYMATARYLKHELEESGFDGVDEVDSAVGRSRSQIINQFAPYYNGLTSRELEEQGLKETRILISTDVLSEGLNLQDATRLINYDLHWNPVRLMQRIGRVDRRMNPGVEALIKVDHPDRAAIRGTVFFWNFLPPDELEQLLRLYSRVAHKTLRISRTFGIEGKKLLKPEDDYEALKDFTHAYEGTTTPIETMHLEYQKLLQENPDLPARLDSLPNKVFSAKHHPSDGAKGIFFCYMLPAPPVSKKADGGEGSLWSEETGHTRWYLFDLASQTILEEPAEIVNVIRSKADTPFYRSVPQTTLVEIRKKMEKHIKDSYFKQVQAPIGVKATLKAWMELS